MKKECKVILIVTTILYIILAVLKVLKGFDISELSDITKFSSIYISISSIILLVYVWDRGDSEIAKIGLCCYLIGFIVDILQIAFFKQKLTPSTFDKTLDFIDSATSIGGSFMAMIALFGLIPSKSSTGSKIYVVAVISYLIHGAITLITIVNKFEYTSIIYDIDLLFVEAYQVAEYGFIVYYLLNKSPNLVAKLVDMTPSTVPPVQETQPPAVGQQFQVPVQPATPMGVTQSMPRPQVTPPPFGTTTTPPTSPPQQRQYTPNPFK